MVDGCASRVSAGVDGGKLHALLGLERKRRREVDLPMLEALRGALRGLIREKMGRSKGHSESPALTDGPSAANGFPSPSGRGFTPSDPEGIGHLLEQDEISTTTVLAETDLTPEEFLTVLVEKEGGRMWQSKIAETTSWSKATVSRRLEKMENENMVRRERIGRRKVVFLPENPPEPFRPASGGQESGAKQIESRGTP